MHVGAKKPSILRQLSQISTGLSVERSSENENLLPPARLRTGGRTKHDARLLLPARSQDEHTGAQKARG